MARPGGRSVGPRSTSRSWSRSPSACWPVPPATGASSRRPTSSAPRTTPPSSPPPGPCPAGRSSTGPARSWPTTRRTRTASGYRIYAGRTISQVVGYASSTYGRAGLERAYDAELSGLAGDDLSDAFAKFGADRYDPKDLTLSLSYDLQRAAVAALGKRRGAVVMLDPATGEVLALASTPTYDASAIADPDTAKTTFEALQADPAQPLLPRATLGRYVPGLGVQDRDRRCRPRLRGDHARDDLQAAARSREDRAAGGGLPGPRRPPSRRPARPRSTSSTRPRSRATSTTR